MSHNNFKLLSSLLRISYSRAALLKLSISSSIQGFSTFFMLNLLKKTLSSTEPSFTILLFACAIYLLVLSLCQYLAYKISEDASLKLGYAAFDGLAASSVSNHPIMGKVMHVYQQERAFNNTSQNDSEFISKAVIDLNRTSLRVLRPISEAIAALPEISILVILLLLTDSAAAIVILIPFILLFLSYNKLMANKRKKLSLITSNYSKHIILSLQELFDFSIIINIFPEFHLFIRDRYISSLKKIRNAQLTINVLSIPLKTAAQSFAILIILFNFLLNVDLATSLISLAILQRLLNGINQIIDSLKSVDENHSHIERLYGCCGLAAKNINHENNINNSLINSTILTSENLSLNCLVYQDQRNQFKFSPQTINFITGRSGVGKTTLMNHLIGATCLESVTLNLELTDNESGCCELYQFDSSNSHLYKLVAQKYVTGSTQRSILIDSSIDQNIFISHSATNHLKSINSKFKKDVLDKSSIDENFANRYNPEQSYDLESILSTTISRTSNDLSGGEAKRIMNARAIQKEKCLMMIFDEPTSGLDSKVTYQFIKTLKSLISNNTILIVITHDDRLISIPHSQIFEYK